MQNLELRDQIVPRDVTTMTSAINISFKSRESSRYSFIFFCLLSASASAFVFSGNGTGDLENRGDLFPQILKDEAVARLNELGKVSDASGHLERTFLSPASMRAIKLIHKWMEDAGLRTWVDEMGNVHGRVEGANADAGALLIGSHLDTVIDAGMFNGSLGIISAVSALKVMHMTGKLEKLRRPVEVIAFSDEEGVRFQTTFLGSAAIAGALPATTLKISDKRGMTIEDVLKENSLEVTDENLSKLKYDPTSVWRYLEVHIEQGPVLERVGFPLGVVKGIAGQTRLKVTVRGTQGHAGTVPMSMRQDPMAAAAELIVLLLEKYQRGQVPAMSFQARSHILWMYEQWMTLGVRLLFMSCQNACIKYVTNVQFPALSNVSMMQVL